MRLKAILVAAALTTGLFAAPASAGVLPDRAEAVPLPETGGPKPPCPAHPPTCGPS